MNARRNGSWHATGLVRMAWERIDPPRRDELATRMGVAGSDLSARNNSTPEKPQRLTLEYAQRIVAAVRQDEPTFSVADLGAPAWLAAETSPTIDDRLRALEEKLDKLATEEDVRTGFETLRRAIDRLARRRNRATAQEAAP